MSQYSCPFTLTFDGICVPLVFNDMILWVGADEALKILRLSHHVLHSLPDCEKTTLNRLDPCYNNKKCYISALGVGLLVYRLVYSKGCDFNLLPERANAFANIFLTDVISDIKTGRLMCAISKKENDILNLLNEPVAA
jgi:hypothetical protein